MTTDEITAINLAASRGDADAVLYLELKANGALILPRGGGWDLEYSPAAPAATPWTDDEGALYATADVSIGGH